MELWKGENTIEQRNIRARFDFNPESRVDLPLTYTGEEIKIMEDLPMEYYCNPLVPKHGLVLIAGTPFVGMSTFAVQLGASIATGQIFLIFWFQPATVLYLHLENRRWQPMVKGILESSGQDCSNFWFTSEPMSFDEMCEVIKYHDAEVTFIDCQRFATTVKKIEELRATTNTTLVVLHHTTEREYDGLVSRRNALAACSDVIIGIKQDLNQKDTRIIEVISHSEPETMTVKATLTGGHFEFLPAGQQAIYLKRQLLVQKFYAFHLLGLSPTQLIKRAAKETGTSEGYAWRVYSQWSSGLEY